MATGDQSGAAREPWHLQKGVPIAVILGMLLQTVGVVWFGATAVAGVNHTVAEHQRRIVALEAANARMNDEARRVSDVLARLEERLAAQTTILRRLEETLMPRRDGQR